MYQNDVEGGDKGLTNKYKILNTFTYTWQKPNDDRFSFVSSMNSMADVGLTIYYQFACTFLPE